MNTTQEDMDGFRDFLAEAKSEEDPIKRGDHYCFLIDQMLGNNTEKKGYIRTEESFEILEELKTALDVVLEENPKLELPKRKKFESYGSMAEDRVLDFHKARANIKLTREFVKKSQGGFLAGSVS